MSTCKKRRMKYLPAAPLSSVTSSAYINTLINKMSYLSEKYGINTPVKVPELTPTEKIIEGDLGKLLQIIDDHLAFWSTTSSRRTIDALSSARGTTLALINALHSDKAVRLNQLCAAIYDKDLKSLMYAIRMPRANPRNPEVESIRAKTVTIRCQFKDLLKRTILAIRDVSDQTSDELFNAISLIPRERINSWLDNQAQAVDHAYVEQDLETVEEVTLPDPNIPHGMYQ